MRGLLIFVMLWLLPVGRARAEPTDMLDPAQLADDTDQPPTRRQRRAQGLQAPLLTIESLMILAPPAIYYWSTADLQSEDWDLGWDWHSWRAKLFSTDVFILDTNRFEANGLRHPLAGALSYQVGRANDVGVLGTTVIDFTTSVLWEYFAEFPEKPSINDIIVNTASGP